MSILKLQLFIVSLLFFCRADAQNQDNMYNEHLIPVMNKAGKWGYINTANNQIAIEPKYDWADLFRNNIARVSVKNTDATNYDNSGLAGWIDTTGKEIFAPQFTNVYDVEKYGDIGGKNIIDGLKEVVTKNRETGIVSLPDGTWKVPAGLYSDFYFYDKNHFLADKKYFFVYGKKYDAPQGCIISNVDTSLQLFYIQKENDDSQNGLCTWNGKILIQPEYLDIQYIPEAKRIIRNRFNGKLSLAALMKMAKDNNRNDTDIIVDLCDNNGRVIASYKSQYQADIINDSTGSYAVADTYYYFSLEDGKLLPPKDTLLDNDRYQLFSQNGLYGIKDENRNAVIEPQYKKLRFISPSLIIAARENKDSFNYKTGVIDIHNKIVIPFMYDALDFRPEQSRFSAYKNDRYGQIDTAGEVCIDFKYRNEFFFDEDNRAMVYVDGKNGVIDRNGKEIIPVQYDGVTDLRQTDSINELLYTAEKNNRYALFDKNGKMIIPFDYGFISVRKEDFKQGWVSIEDTARQHYGLYNIQNGIIIPPVYNIIKVYDNFLIAAKRNDNDYDYRLLDIKGNSLTDSDYTKMDYINGYLSCRRNGACGLLNTKGKTIVSFKYNYIWEKTSDLIMAQQGNDYFYVDTQGKEYRYPGN